MATTTNERKTKKDYFNQIKANYNLTDDEVAFIDHEIELLSKKSGADAKPSARQIENNKVKASILEAMENAGEGARFTITEMYKNFTCFDDDMTTQRISALVTQLIDEGKVVRIEEKRKAYFQLA